MYPTKLTIELKKELIKKPDGITRKQHVINFMKKHPDVFGAFSSADNAYYRERKKAGYYNNSTRKKPAKVKPDLPKMKVKEVVSKAKPISINGLTFSFPTNTIQVGGATIAW